MLCIRFFARDAKLNILVKLNELHTQDRKDMYPVLKNVPSIIALLIKQFRKYKKPLFVQIMTCSINASLVCI